MSEAGAGTPPGRVGAPVRTQDPAGDSATLKDRSRPGRRAYSLPPLDVPEAAVPAEHARSAHHGSPGTTRVRYAAGQVSAGGCPFLTAFDLPDADYAAARAVFVQMKDDAWKRADEIKKELGEKWDEVTGRRK